MRDGADTEIQRLERLHQSAELELLLIAARGTLTSNERELVSELEQRKQQLRGRIAWFQSILKEHTRPARE
jgi:hypothetical protein